MTIFPDKSRGFYFVDLLFVMDILWPELIQNRSDAMAYNGIETRQLVKKIEERKRFLKKVINFVEDIVLNEGEVIMRVPGPANIHVVKVLNGFDNFFFMADWGQTVMGGNEVKVWYSSNSEGINPDKTLSVLYVYYQPAKFNIDECVVRHFDEKNQWQFSIDYAIKNKKKLIVQMKRKRNEVMVKKLEQVFTSQKERSKIETEAKRLGIY